MKLVCFLLRKQILIKHASPPNLIYQVFQMNLLATLWTFYRKYQFFSRTFFFFTLELGSNPLKSAGVEAAAFADLKKVSYIRIADTNITEIPKGKGLHF